MRLAIDPRQSRVTTGLSRSQGARVQNCLNCAPPPTSRASGDEGNRTEARGLLAPIYNSEGFDTPVMQQAKLLLDQLM
jgi:hypothetical protein